VTITTLGLTGSNKIATTIHIDWVV